MTIPSWLGLETALRGLNASQAAIDTTGHNIANANTPGYSRQVADLTETNALVLPAFSSNTGVGMDLGTGVTVDSINRIRDQFLDVQYRTQNSLSNGYSQQYTILSQVETALGESSGAGLSSALNSFWSAWTSLSNNPTSTAAQQALVSDGQTLASTLNQLSSQLGTIENQVDSQWSTLTNASNGQIASDANQIQALNLQIAQAKVSGQSANDMMDQRDQLIDDLSSYGHVSVTTDSSTGMVTVGFGNGAAPGSATPALVAGGTVDLASNLTEANLNSTAGGKLGALKALYDSTTGTGQLPGYLNTLDGVAKQLAGTVNGAITAAAPAGSNPPLFFVTSNAAAIFTAANISVNTAGINFSTTNPPYTAAEASAVYGLQGGVAAQAYNAFVTQIGSDVQTASNNQTTQQALLTAIGNQRQSVSGVSLDEEMTNLITFQRAYQASARVMNAVDETLNTLINQVGAGI